MEVVSLPFGTPLELLGSHFGSAWNHCVPLRGRLGPRASKTARKPRSASGRKTKTYKCSPDLGWGSSAKRENYSCWGFILSTPTNIKNQVLTCMQGILQGFGIQKVPKWKWFCYLFGHLWNLLEATLDLRDQEPQKPQENPNLS